MESDPEFKTAMLQGMFSEGSKPSSAQTGPKKRNWFINFLLELVGWLSIPLLIGKFIGFLAVIGVTFLIQCMLRLIYTLSFMAGAACFVVFSLVVLLARGSHAFEDMTIWWGILKVTGMFALVCIIPAILDVALVIFQLWFTGPKTKAVH